METKSASPWRARLGYPLVFFAAFIVFFHITLPWDAIQANLADQARKQGYAVSMVSLGPSLGFGATALGVTVAPAERPAGLPADAPTPSMTLESVTVRPSLFPVGVHLASKAFGGTLEGTFSRKGKDTNVVELTGKHLELEKTALKPFIGLDLQGDTSLDVNLSLPADFAKTTGEIHLSGKEVMLVGGTVANFDLPKLGVGALEMKVKAADGKASLEAFSITGTDLEAKGEGDFQLSSRAMSTAMKLRIEFKLGDEWLKRNSFIQMGLGQAGRPDSKGFYIAEFGGTVGVPRPTLKQ
jgi:type II secretion system protein N